MPTSIDSHGTERLAPQARRVTYVYGYIVPARGAYEFKVTIIVAASIAWMIDDIQTWQHVKYDEDFDPVDVDIFLWTSIQR